MSLYWLGLAALAFSISCFGTQRLSRVRSRLYWVDVPNERSLHRRPTPRTGGIAILGAIVIGCLVPVVISWPDGRVANRTDLLWVLVAALMIGVVSLFEDRVGLGLGVRLSVHGLAAVGLVWSTGLTVNQIVVPAVVSIALGGWMATALTVLSIVWMANLYNFMDGIDGFAGGMTVVGFGFLAGVAWKEGHTGVVAASLVIAAAAGGFLVHNLPPAAIFMGDGGSVVVGFLAAALAVMGIHDGLFDMWVPLLVFSPFVVDATITLLRRLLRGERVWQAHREHYYQRLVLAGWGHRRTVLAEYGLMGLCCAAAIVYIKAGEAGKLGVLFACLIMYWALARGVAIVEAHGVNRHERLA